MPLNAEYAIDGVNGEEAISNLWWSNNKGIRKKRRAWARPQILLCGSG
jgi:hypothetical protein